MSRIRPIDLNTPGALEALHRSRAAHFEKVRTILEGVLQRPDTEVPRWMRVSFGARGVDGMTRELDSTRADLAVCGPAGPGP